MKIISSLEATVLGLLSEQSMHPYQMEKIVQERDMRYWTELSMSSIYKVLRQLEKSGFVRATIGVSAQNRSRKTYELTEEGRSALKEKILEIVSQPEHLIHRFDIGASNLGVLSHEEAGGALVRYRDALTEKLAGYKALESFMNGQGCPQHSLALARRPQFLLKAEIDFINDYIERLNTDRSKGEPAHEQ